MTEMLSTERTATGERRVHQQSRTAKTFTSCCEDSAFRQRHVAMDHNLISDNLAVIPLLFCSFSYQFRAHLDFACTVRTCRVNRPLTAKLASIRVNRSGPRNLRPSLASVSLRSSWHCMSGVLLLDEISLCHTCQLILRSQFILKGHTKDLPIAP